MPTLTLEQTAQKEHFRILYIHSEPSNIPEAKEQLTAEGYTVIATTCPEQTTNRNEDAKTLRTFMRRQLQKHAREPFNLAVVNHPERPYRSTAYTILNQLAHKQETPICLAWMAQDYPSLTDMTAAGRALRTLNYLTSPTNPLVRLPDPAETIIPTLKDLEETLALLSGEVDTTDEHAFFTMFQSFQSGTSAWKEAAKTKITQALKLTEETQQRLTRQGTYRQLDRRLGLMYQTLTKP